VSLRKEFEEREIRRYRAQYSGGGGPSQSAPKPSATITSTRRGASAVFLCDEATGPRVEAAVALTRAGVWALMLR
jgi:hypothetical protein